MKNPPLALDLFCGCGAVTEGIKRSGFKVVAAVDFDAVACASYRLNHPEVHLVQADIREVDPSEFKDMFGGERLELLIVCAPCQPFSSQNRKRAEDVRSQLILQGLRFAEALSPRAIFFENVPGLVASTNAPILLELKRGLTALGYALSAPHRVNAADYGVPQRRNRCVMIATKDRDLPDLPPPVTPAGNRIQVRDAIGDLPALACGEATQDDPLHRARTHSVLSRARMRHIPKDGGSRFSLPEELELRCHKGHSGHPDVYGRMSWGDVAPTLTTGCTDITRGRFMHPQDDRAITLREAARLQTFGDNYRFAGTSGDVARQIGNAVPVLLVENLASALLPG